MSQNFTLNVSTEDSNNYFLQNSVTSWSDEKTNILFQEVLFYCMQQLPIASSQLPVFSYGKFSLLKI